MSDRRVLLNKPRSTPADPLGQRNAMERIWAEDEVFYYGARKYDDGTVRRWAPILKSELEDRFEIYPNKVWQAIDPAKEDSTSTVVLRENIFETARARLLHQMMSMHIVNPYMLLESSPDKRLLLRRNK